MNVIVTDVYEIDLTVEISIVIQYLCSSQAQHAVHQSTILLTKKEKTPIDSIAREDIDERHISG